MARPTIAVLGASGLIGEAVAMRLRRDGFPLLAMARRFTPAQASRLGDAALESPIVAMEPVALGAIVARHQVDIVVNCIGVLQDSPRGTVEDAHGSFVKRLVETLERAGRPILLVHISIPGQAQDDTTPFSQTKREAERIIAASNVAHAILRPGFVLAEAAYGGSALMRALAALPFTLPAPLRDSPFAITDVEDIARTISGAARQWQNGKRDFAATWDVMSNEVTSVGTVLDALARRAGGPVKRLPLPSWLLGLGAGAGDLAARLGWSPPMRSTALREMRRGVAGDPQGWIAATGIAPTPLSAVLERLPATVQEVWFARLYLIKPLAIATLSLFWLLSGLIALTVAFKPAMAILTAHGFPTPLAMAITIVSSVLDMAIGVAIAMRRSCAFGLYAGIAVSLFYMASAALITPGLWIEPLGALVKTGPAIVLMATMLAILDER